MSVSRLLPAELIRQVADATDIVELIGNDLPLRKTGGTYTTLCFCHAEKTPSFNVNPGRQSFKCFGCGVHGSVIDYVMLREEATFPAAVRRLAERAGIPILEDVASVKGTKAAAPVKQTLRAPAPRRTAKRAGNPLDRRGWRQRLRRTSPAWFPVRLRNLPRQAGHEIPGTSHPAHAGRLFAMDHRTAKTGEAVRHVFYPLRERTQHNHKQPGNLHHRVTGTQED